MSWVRSAVNKAVEGGQSNFGRAVRTYADSVVLHASNAVAGGARIIQDRIVARNMQSFKHTVKRLEEVSVSCRGIERVQLLRRWLVALREVERLTVTCNGTKAKDQDNEFLHDESKDSPTPQPTLIYYVDPAAPDELKNFRDVFLSSQALEGITMSMILDAPNEEEVSLLSEIYGLCIKGGKEEHTALLSSVQDLAKAFSGYEVEVLAKREELLQYVQNAISGLKVNADLIRIEVEACNLKEKIENMKADSQDGNFVNSPKATAAIEALDEAMVTIQMCSTLEELLLKKKYFSYGDSPQLHAEKVDKLKVLSESLANSSTKAETRITENRSQKEEALHFRVTKSNEVSQVEKKIKIKFLENLKFLIQTQGEGNGGQNCVSGFMGDSEVKGKTNPIVNSVGGILSVWSESSFVLEKKVIGNKFILLEGTWKGNGKKITIVNIYSSCDANLKRNLWGQIKQLRSASQNK
ncbi:hypothetical protein GmHk_13G037517 [Glycine max]|nr:hypothetical protein GmHk_13G037517 [Glycine max]